MNKINSNDILNYSKSGMINVNTCIVFLQIDINRSKKRILKDNKNGFKRFSNNQINYINKNLYVMYNNQNHLLNKIKNKFKYKIFIESNKNTNSNVKKIKNFLLNLNKLNI